MTRDGFVVGRLLPIPRRFVGEKQLPPQKVPVGPAQMEGADRCWECDAAQQRSIFQLSSATHALVLQHYPLRVRIVT